MVGLRRKHWVLMSLSATGFLLVLVVTSRQSQLSRPQSSGDDVISGDDVSEGSFMLRRISNKVPEESANYDRSAESQPDHLTAAGVAPSEGSLLVPQEGVLGTQDDMSLVAAPSAGARAAVPGRESQGSIVQQEESLSGPFVPQSRLQTGESGTGDATVQTTGTAQFSATPESSQTSSVSVTRVDGVIGLPGHSRTLQTSSREANDASSSSSSFSFSSSSSSSSKQHVSTVSLVAKSRKVAPSSGGQLTVPAPPKKTALKKAKVQKMSGVTPATFQDLKKQAQQLLQFRLQYDLRDSPKEDAITIGRPIPPDKVRRVLIVSTWRCGSTFLGDILNANPGTYYSFEPLHHLLKNQHLIEGPLVRNTTEFLLSAMKCDFSEQDFYLEYLRNNSYLIEHNSRIWDSCAMNRAICFDKAYLSEVCRLMPVNVMKTVRIGLAPVLKLIERPELNLKVIYLMRDPRGFFQSRMKLKWCKSSHCSDPGVVCADLMKDIKYSRMVKEKYPDRFIEIRYEDLASEPEETSKKIFSFLGLTYNKHVQKFLDEHTQIKSTYSKRKLGAYTTFRDSKSTTFAWREALPFAIVDKIQRRCKDVLKVMHLRSFDNEIDYKNLSIPVLLT